jgi:hypothetical protein
VKTKAMKEFNMGLKAINYYISDLDLTLPTAYCKVNRLDINKYGKVMAYAEIQQTREDCENRMPLQVISFNFINNKVINAFEQAYTTLKETILIGWEDDIVPPS